MTFSQPVADRMRAAFRQMNRFMVLVWRLGLGPWLSIWPPVTGRLLVVRHVGRKSGLPHLAPLNYATVGDAVYVLAGFGPRTDWFRNLMRQPAAEIWLPDGRWGVIAEDVSEHPDRLELLRQVLIGSGFAAHAFGVSPRLPDDRLIALTCDYRIVRFTRTRAVTGPGGPSDLTWVWPVLVAAAIGLRMCRRAGGCARRGPI